MRKIAMLIIVIGLATGLVGCKNGEKELTKEDYIKLTESYKALYEDSSERVNVLESMLVAYGENVDNLDTISKPLVLPDGTKSFLNINDSIVISEDINLDPYSKVPDQSRVNLNNKVAIRPTKNWVMQFIDDGIRLEHTTGVYGEVVSYNYIGEYDGVSCYADMLVPYIESLGIKKFEPKIIFMGDTRIGYEVDLNIKANRPGEDAEPYRYKFGLTIVDGAITSYKFFYKQTDSDDAMKELVNNTVKSISVDGYTITVE